ncbi:beta family protein [Gilliamella apicola]|uniref:beta family protein n=1 Tax=Gilliamella apicola TaxID=1196095 RepID=UPI002FEE499B
MFHIVNLKSGMNDINALINIDNNDKNYVLPFINTRGELKNDYLFKNFLLEWGEYPFLVDTSLIAPDMYDKYNQVNGLLDHSNAFQRKYDFYEKILQVNPNLIPVISILPTSTMRDNVHFLFKLQNRQYKKIAIRVTDLSENSINNLFTLLASSSDPNSILVLYDIGSIVDKNINTIQIELSNILQSLSNLYSGLNVSVISTSFPSQKTPNRDVWEEIPNLDLPLYFNLKSSFPGINLIYGDYGATNPTSPMEYIPGMQIIPCVTYYDNYHWYQMKTGNSHEFNKFVDLANCLVSESFYHGNNFSWGDSQIYQIANKIIKNGNSGTWNGIRINQHITSIARMT